ncbi:hypothetical protein KVT40_001001 [Elsinoe batatas]|uniref:Uncharacterized protein n=1 Tax=Elsinoe batatas TaxID=2601811 RepID=A0A8K0PJ63_9PEZI|nr:hypothetical protein KVT40_001001 [Elsinoe batatas]
MNGWGVFAIILILLAIFGFGGWTIYRNLRARRLGLPPPPLNPFAKSRTTPSTAYVPPSPAAGGPIGWLKAKFASLSNPRTSAGAYESTSYNRSQRRGFDPLDPDEAWDSRVGNEADYVEAGRGGGPYYESQELGLRGPGQYEGAGYEGVGGGIGAERGRSRSRQRELDERYDAEMGRGGNKDPFGDGAERSDLRGVSPRPVVERERSTDGRDRRSAFRENM